MDASRFVRLCAVALACCVVLSSAPGHSSETAASKEERTSEAKGPAPAPEAPEASEAARKPALFGLVQADFYAGDAGESGAADSSFFTRRARIGVRGTLTAKIGYRLMVALDGSNSDTVAGDARTFDAYLDVALSEALALRVGQYKYTFDREGRRSAAALPLITRARVTSLLAGRLGQTGGAFRDLGVELHGSRGAWSYALGVVNGNGINKRDDNGDKDVYLRAAGDLAPGLNLGAGYAAGKTAAGSDEEIVTLDAMYERGPLAIMGAYYAAAYSRPAGADVEPKGFYVVGTHRVGTKVELALRYQETDYDSNRPQQRFESLDFGVTYYIAPKGRWGGLKAAVNYMARSAESAAPAPIWEERGATLIGGAGDVVLARLQASF